MEGGRGASLSIMGEGGGEDYEGGAKKIKNQNNFLANTFFC